MAKTIIIVEGDSDKFIFEAILRHIREENNVRVVAEIVPEIEFIIKSDEGNPEKPTALIAALENLVEDFSKQHLNKVAIIRDLDDKTIENKILSVNNAIKGAYEVVSGEIKKVNESTSIKFIDNLSKREYTIDFACHFVNLNGSGEIEDILKAIKTQDSPIADCVENHLPQCLETTKEELKKKALVKLWLNNYIRYDTLSPKHRDDKNTLWKNVMEKRTGLFDFGSNLKELQELKDFLKMMCE